MSKDNVRYLCRQEKTRDFAMSDLVLWLCVVLSLLNCICAFVAYCIGIGRGFGSETAFNAGDIAPGSLFVLALILGPAGLVLALFWPQSPRLEAERRLQVEEHLERLRMQHTKSNPQPKVKADPD